MFNYYNNSKNTILGNLLDLSRDISSYVSIFRDISDTMYIMKVSEIQSRFNSIIGYQNSLLTTELSSKIFMLSFDKNKANALKLLDISNAILDLGSKVR